MAIISSLIGGVCGFITFLTALTFFNVGFFPALGLYVLVGFGLTVMIIATGLSWRALNASVLLGAETSTYAASVRTDLAKRG